MPHQVHVTGTSAGSYGSLYWTPQVREMYPEARLTQLGDAGVGVITSDFLGTTMDKWNITAHAPRWIPDLDPDRVDWRRLGFDDVGKRVAAFYPEATLAQYSSAYDLVQTGFYTLMGGFRPAWPVEMQAILDSVSAEAPNFRYFVGPGKDHCATPEDAFYTVRADDVLLHDWVDQLVNSTTPPDSVRCTNCISSDDAAATAAF